MTWVKVGFSLCVFACLFVHTVINISAYRYCCLSVFLCTCKSNCSARNTTLTACHLISSKDAHPSQHWWHAFDADVGLLVLVDQAHQLLGILSIHQHDGTGKGVCLSELAAAWSGREGAEGRKCEILGCNGHHLFVIILKNLRPILQPLGFAVTSAAALASSLTSKITAWAPLFRAMRVWKSKNTLEPKLKDTHDTSPDLSRTVCVSLVAFLTERLHNMQKREWSAAEANGKGACHHPKPTQGGSHAPGFRPQNTRFRLSTCHGGKEFNSGKCQVLHWLMQRWSVSTAWREETVNIRTEGNHGLLQDLCL